MRSIVIILCTVAALSAIPAVVQAEDFTLTGTEQKDVTTTYYFGLLYDYSRANILPGGNVKNRLKAYDTSTVDISGGFVDWLYAYDNSTVDISGGSVERLWINNLRRTSENRINITGGTVGTFQALIDVVGNEHFSLTTNLTIPDLAGYGVQAADGTISNFSFSKLSAYDSSTVDISGGIVLDSYTYDTSKMNIFGGSVEGLEAYNSSTVDISGGSVNLLRAYDTSTVDILGGSVGYIDTRSTSTVNISDDGSVDFLDTCDTSTVNISGGSVNMFWVGGASTVDISGGSVDHWLAAYNSSIVDISGGSVNWFEAHHTSTVNVSGGIVEYLEALEHSTVTFLGKDFVLGDGLWLIDNELFGFGILSGRWMDGTYWTTRIAQNELTATVLLIPEPATLLLFALGGLGLLGKRR